MLSMVTLDSIAENHVLHVILLGVGVVIFTGVVFPHTLVPLKSLGLDSQRVKKLALKLHARAHELMSSFSALCS